MRAALRWCTAALLIALAVAAGGRLADAWRSAAPASPAVAAGPPAAPPAPGAASCPALSIQHPSAQFDHAETMLWISATITGDLPGEYHARIRIADARGETLHEQVQLQQLTVFPHDFRKAVDAAVVVRAFARLRGTAAPECDQPTIHITLEPLSPPQTLQNCNDSVLPSQSLRPPLHLCNDGEILLENLPTRATP